MLVLSRAVNEEIVIGENIVVTVLRCDGGKTRLGLKAPKDVPIYRREVLDAIQAKAATAEQPSQKTA